MKTTAVAVVVGVLMALAVAQAAVPVEVCLGVVLPVTGERNVEAMRILDAARAAAEDHTAAGTIPGVPVHLITDRAAIDSAGYVQFGPRRMYAQVTGMTCVNGTSPIAIIGDLGEAVVREMSSVATLMQVPLISPGARDPALSMDRDSNAFTAVFRSSLRDEAEVIKAVFRRYGWTSFVLWHSNSEYGTALSDSFAGSGLEMVDVPVPASDQGIETERALQRLLTLRFRIIVVHAEPTLARLMMNLSNRHGMLNGDYLFFGSMTWTAGDDISSAVFNNEEREYLQGVVGISIPQLGEANTRFLKRLADRQPEYYPPYFAEQPPYTRICAYDAVTMVVTAVKNLTDRGLPYTGKWLMNQMTTSGITFTGAAGTAVAMTAATGSRVSRYALTNFQGGAFKIVANWSPAGLVMSTTASIIWPGNNPDPAPTQDVPRHHVSLTQYLDDLAIAIAVLYGLVSLLVHYLIAINTDHEVIKASSPIFCHIILLGGDVAYLMCGLSALGAEQTCLLVPALIAICFSLVFGALVAKTYRIHRIFNSQELRIKTPTNTHLFAITGALVAYDILVISIWAGTDKPHAGAIPSPHDVTASYIGCIMNDAGAWTAALFIPKAVVVLAGAWLAYKVRDLNHNFNEARYISLALYNVLLLSAILFGLVEAFPYSVDVVYLLKSVGSATVAFITVMILFAPKFWDVYVTKDWIDYHSNSSYISGVLVHKSSKGSYAKAASAHAAAVEGAAGAGAGAAGAAVGAAGAGAAAQARGSPGQSKAYRRATHSYKARGPASPGPVGGGSSGPAPAGFGGAHRGRGAPAPANNAGNSSPGSALRSSLIGVGVGAGGGSGGGIGVGIGVDSKSPAAGAGDAYVVVTANATTTIPATSSASIGRPNGAPPSTGSALGTPISQAKKLPLHQSSSNRGGAPMPAPMPGAVNLSGGVGGNGNGMSGIAEMEMTPPSQPPQQLQSRSEGVVMVSIDTSNRLPPANAGAASAKPLSPLHQHRIPGPPGSDANAAASPVGVLSPVGAQASVGSSMFASAAPGGAAGAGASYTSSPSLDASAPLVAAAAGSAPSSVAPAERTSGRAAMAVHAPALGAGPGASAGSHPTLKGVADPTAGASVPVQATSISPKQPGASAFVSSLPPV